jgi:hypothetical protein
MNLNGVLHILDIIVGVVTKFDPDTAGLVGALGIIYRYFDKKRVVKKTIQQTLDKHGLNQ